LLKDEADATACPVGPQILIFILQQAQVFEILEELLFEVEELALLSHDFEWDNLLLNDIFVLIAALANVFGGSSSHRLLLYRLRLLLSHDLV